MHRLGCTLYLWSPDEQDRFLRDALGPFTHRVLDSGLVSGFWFDRFDARGPHVFFVLTTRENTVGPLEREVRNLLEGWLETPPSKPPLSLSDLEALHVACRGKTLCAADRLDGFATHSSFEIFSHPISGYPFSLGRYFGEVLDADAPDESPWRAWTETAFWTIGLLGKPVLAPVMRWLAAIDQLMDDEQAADFWRYSLRCLLPELPMLESLDKVDTAMLERFISDKNLPVLRDLWDIDLHYTASSELADPTALVRAGLAPALDAHRWKFLREVVFVTLKQMRIRIRRQAQLYAFALDRRLKLRAVGDVD